MGKGADHLTVEIEWKSKNNIFGQITTYKSHECRKVQSEYDDDNRNQVTKWRGAMQYRIEGWICWKYEYCWSLHEQVRGEKSSSDFYRGNEISGGEKSYPVVFWPGAIIMHIWFNDWWQVFDETAIFEKDEWVRFMTGSEVEIRNLGGR